MQQAYTARFYKCRVSDKRRWFYCTNKCRGRLFWDLRYPVTKRKSSSIDMSDWSRLVCECCCLGNMLSICGDAVAMIHGTKLLEIDLCGSWASCYAVLCGHWSGTVPERHDGRLYNTATVFSPAGNMIAKHRKVVLSVCLCICLLVSVYLSVNK